MGKLLLIEPSTLRLRLKILKPLIHAGKGHTMAGIRWTDRDGVEYLSLTATYYREYLYGDNTGNVIGLRWRTPDGIEEEQAVCLTKRESNLGKGEVWYFVCNQTGHPCRTLYFTGGRFYSRWALPTRYDYQNMGRTEREQRFAYSDLPSMYRRKYHYRGKITPIGRRYDLQNEKAERSENAFLSSFCKGRSHRRRR